MPNEFPNSLNKIKGFEGQSFKPGMMPWHDENCNLEFRYEKNGVRGYWCPKHNQWAYEFATVIYKFETER